MYGSKTINFYHLSVIIQQSLFIFSYRNVFSNDLNHTPQSFEVVKDITSQDAYNVSHNTKIEWAPTELMGDERYIMFR